MPNVLSTISGTLWACATCIPPQYVYWHTYMQIAYLSYLTNRTDVVLGVSYGLHEYSLGFFIDSRADFRGVIGSDKLDHNPVFFEKHYATLNCQLWKTRGGRAIFGLATFELVVCLAVIGSV